MQKKTKLKRFGVCAKGFLPCVIKHKNKFKNKMFCWCLMIENIYFWNKIHENQSAWSDFVVGIEFSSNRFVVFSTKRNKKKTQWKQNPEEIQSFFSTKKVSPPLFGLIFHSISGKKWKFLFHLIGILFFKVSLSQALNYCFPLLSKHLHFSWDFFSGKKCST